MSFPKVENPNWDRIQHWRNRIGVPIVNFFARLLLTREYNQFVEGSIQYGLRSAARDTKEGNDAPPDPHEL